MGDVIAIVGYGFLGLLALAVLVAGWEQLRDSVQLRRQQAAVEPASYSPTPPAPSTPDPGLPAPATTPAATLASTEPPPARAAAALRRDEPAREPGQPA
jgi:hypothetical protein